MKYLFFSGAKGVGPMIKASSRGQESGIRRLTIDDANSQGSHLVQALDLMWCIHKGWMIKLKPLNTVGTVERSFYYLNIDLPINVL